MSAAIEYAPAFVPSDIGHAKRKAKQLRRTFPRLTFSSAQQVTSQTLGFDDWHALQGAVQSGLHPSPLDSQIMASELAARHRYQTVTLARRLNISEADAGVFLLTWELTHESRSEIPTSRHGLNRRRTRMSTRWSTERYGLMSLTCLE